MKKIEHIGIAVPNLEEADAVFSKLLNRSNYKVEKVEREGVSTSFYQLGENKIELLEATHAESAIAKYLEKRGQGIHHIAIDVEDIHVEMKRLKDSGFQLINDSPQQGADNKLICFLHPKSTCGVLIELCQEITTTP
jgi:methylmalonyl-CoA/ethylmalonyl-CoA epimerase